MQTHHHFHTKSSKFIKKERNSAKLKKNVKNVFYEKLKKRL